MTGRIVKTSKLFFSLIKVIPQFINPNNVVSFMILLAPFSIGDVLPFVSTHHYPILFFVDITLILLLYDKLLNYRKLLRVNFVLPVIIFWASFYLSMYFGFPYQNLVQYTWYDSSFSGVLKDVILFIPLILTLLIGVYLSIDSVKDIFTYIKMILYSGIIVNAISLLFIITGSNKGFDVFMRLSSTFGDPNYLGRFEVFIISVSLCYIFFAKKDVFIRFLFVINIIISFIILYLSYSRSALITLAIVVSTIILFTRHRYYRYVSIVAVLIVLTYAVVVVGNKRQSPMRATTSQVSGAMVDYSNTTRIALDIAAVEMFLDYPICGIGFRNFYNVYVNYNYMPTDIPLASHVSIVHSWLFSVMGEQGIVGTASLLWILLLMFWLLLKIIRKETDLQFRMIGIILYSLFFTLIFNGLFFPTFYSEMVLALYCGFIGGYFKLYYLRMYR